MLDGRVRHGVMINPAPHTKLRTVPELESECAGYCGAQDTFYVGDPKGVGASTSRPSSTRTSRAFAKLYHRKTALTAADLLNDRVVPFYDAQEVKLTRMLKDRRTEYRSNPEHHEYELYLAVEDVDHSRTKARNPQTVSCISVAPPYLT